MFTKQINPKVDIVKFTGIYPWDVINDFSKLANILHPQIINHHLRILEDKIKEKLQKLGKLATDNAGNEIVVKRTDREYVSHYHVFTEFMNEWAKEKGFNPTVTINCIERNADGNEERVEIQLPSKSPIIFNLLTSDVFSNLVALGYLPKDIGAGSSHGEFTHFLQIFVLVEEYIRNKYTKLTPIELIKMATHYTLINSDSRVWDFIFDKPAGIALFNSPDFFNADLTGAARKGFNIESDVDRLSIDQFPILSSLMQGRVDKRNPHYRKDPSQFFYLSPENEVAIVAAKEKYNDKPGLIINNAIYFDTGDSKPRHVIFDDIKLEMMLYKGKYINDQKLVVADSNLSLIDQICMLFDYQKHLKLKAPNRSLDVLKRRFVRQQKESKKTGCIPHHKEVLNALLESMRQLKSDKNLQPYQSYLNAAISQSFEILEKFELPTIVLSKNLTP